MSGVAFTSRGWLLAWDTNEVRCTDATTGVRLPALTGFRRGEPYDVAPSPDGSRALVAIGSELVLHASLERAGLLSRFHARGGGMAVAHLGDRGLVARERVGLVEWDLASGNELRTLALPDIIYDAALDVSRDRKRISAHVELPQLDSCGIAVVELDTCTQVAAIECGFGALHPDGAAVACIMNDGTARLVDIATTAARLLPAVDAAHGFPRFSADGRRLAVVRFDAVLVLDVATGDVVCRVAAKQPRSAALSADGALVAIELPDRVALHTVSDGLPVTPSGVVAAAAWPSGVAGSPSVEVVRGPIDTLPSEYVVALTGTRAKLVGAWEHRGAATQLRIARGSGLIAAVLYGQRIQTVRTFGATGVVREARIDTDMIGEGGVCGLSPDATLALTAHVGTVGIAELEHGVIRVLGSVAEYVQATAFAADAPIVAAGGKYGAGAWNVATGAAVFAVERRRPVAGVALSPDGTQILVGDHDDGDVTIYDVASGRARARVHLHDLGLAAFDRTGSRIFASSQWGHPVIVDAASGDIIRELPSVVFRAGMSRANDQVLVGRGYELVVWDLATDRELDTIDLRAVDDHVIEATWSPGGRSFAISTKRWILAFDVA